ncbi:hypothetical protein TNCV_2003121 [Trichonephila clavipes]|nr:hypothetical protein TNCV_2003121 [Trichonephila clavipes]
MVYGGSPSRHGQRSPRNPILPLLPIGLYFEIPSFSENTRMSGNNIRPLDYSDYDLIEAVEKEKALSSSPVGPWFKMSLLPCVFNLPCILIVREKIF